MGAIVCKGNLEGREVLVLATSEECLVECSHLGILPNEEEINWKDYNVFEGRLSRTISQWYEPVTRNAMAEPKDESVDTGFSLQKQKELNEFKYSFLKEGSQLLFQLATFKQRWKKELQDIHEQELFAEIIHEVKNILCQIYNHISCEKASMPNPISEVENEWQLISQHYQEQA